MNGGPMETNPRAPWTFSGSKSATSTMHIPENANEISAIADPEMA
jgi:hypothetical protein